MNCFTLLLAAEENNIVIYILDSLWWIHVIPRNVKMSPTVNNDLEDAEIYVVRRVPGSVHYISLAVIEQVPRHVRGNQTKHFRVVSDVRFGPEHRSLARLHVNDAG